MTRICFERHLTTLAMTLKGSQPSSSFHFSCILHNHRKMLPAEGFYNFRDFHSPPLDNAYFQAKPMVLLLGEYSVGKTSFIRYLLERPFPAMQIGPEPTTGKCGVGDMWVCAFLSYFFVSFHNYNTTSFLVWSLGS